MLALVIAVKSDGGATAGHSAVARKSSLELKLFEAAFLSLGCHLQPRDEHLLIGLGAIASSFEPAMQS